MAFFIPCAEVIFEEEIKKSRFISYLRHTPDLAAAKAFWAEMRALHPQARHHCWACIAGLPQDSQQYGFSDDGEPAGTAGKPMLAALQGSGLGEVSCVVVRYYGGIQLGTGGLVRAYGNGVQQAVKLVEKQRKVIRQTYQLLCDYDQFDRLNRLFTEWDIEIVEQQFTQYIVLHLAIDPRQVADFSLLLIERFAGKLVLQAV